jgi:serine/threonine-protein kinase
MAYELLTGKRPFKGETVEELRDAHLFLPPPPTSLPPRLDKALRRLLAKDPKERLGIGEFLEALRTWQAPGGEEPKATKPKRRFPFFRS